MYFYTAYKIYIPVWIDQKLDFLLKMIIIYIDLHSSMDRLETDTPSMKVKAESKFTFQYGQIRN